MAAARKVAPTTPELVDIMRSMDQASVVAALLHFQKECAVPTRNAEPTPSYVDLENPICDVHHFAEVASDIVEDMFSYRKATGNRGDSYTFVLNKRQIEKITWLAVQVEDAALRLKERFYAIADGKE